MKLFIISYINKIFYLNFDLYYISLKNKDILNYEGINLDINSLKELEDFLIKSSYNNYFIVDNDMNIDNELIKTIALSNNKLIYIKDNNLEINPIYNLLANKILTIDELLKESF